MSPAPRIRVTGEFRDETQWFDEGGSTWNLLLRKGTDTLAGLCGWFRCHVEPEELDLLRASLRTIRLSAELSDTLLGLTFSVEGSSPDAGPEGEADAGPVPPEGTEPVAGMDPDDVVEAWSNVRAELVRLGADASAEPVAAAEIELRPVPSAAPGTPTLVVLLQHLGTDPLLVEIDASTSNILWWVDGAVSAWEPLPQPDLGLMGTGGEFLDGFLKPATLADHRVAMLPVTIARPDDATGAGALIRGRFFVGEYDPLAGQPFELRSPEGTALPT